MSNPKTAYLEARIRDGFTSEDVRLWQALCRQCEMEVGDSVKFMFTILDIAKHNAVGPIDIVKTGRLCSEQKAINQKFMEALLLAVYEGDDEKEDDDVDDKVVKVLDLTADDDDLSGSYEEEGYGPFDDDRPTSADAYEIDGFVVEDHEEEKPEPAFKALQREGRATVKVSGLARSNALVKRKLATILESDEE